MSKVNYIKTVQQPCNTGWRYLLCAMQIMNISPVSHASNCTSNPLTFVWPSRRFFQVKEGTIIHLSSLQKMRRKRIVIYWYTIYHCKKNDSFTLKCKLFVNLPPNFPGLSLVPHGLYTLDRGEKEKKKSYHSFFICFSWISTKEDNPTLVNNHFLHSLFELVGCSQTFDSSAQHPLLLRQPALQSGYLISQQFILMRGIKRLTFSGDN